MKNLRILGLLTCLAMSGMRVEELDEDWEYTPVAQPEHFQEKVARFNEPLGALTNAIEHYGAAALAVLEKKRAGAADDSDMVEALEEPMRAVVDHMQALAEFCKEFFVPEAAEALAFAIQQVPILQAPELLPMRNFLAMQAPYRCLSARFTLLADLANAIAKHEQELIGDRFEAWCLEIIKPKLAAETGLDAAVLVPRHEELAERGEDAALTDANDQLDMLLNRHELLLTCLSELGKPSEDEEVAATPEKDLGTLIRESVANKSAPWNPVGTSERKFANWMHEHVSSDPDALNLLIDFATAAEDRVAAKDAVQTMNWEMQRYSDWVEAYAQMDFVLFGDVNCYMKLLHYDDTPNPLLDEVHPIEYWAQQDPTAAEPQPGPAEEDEQPAL